MTLAKDEVRALLRIARSIPAVVRDDRYSGYGRASLTIERAQCVAQGLECMLSDMPAEGPREELPRPDKPPSPDITADELLRAAWRYDPEQCQALLQIERLPQFVLALLNCSEVEPEQHEATITAYVRSLIASYAKGQPQ